MLRKICSLFLLGSLFSCAHHFSNPNLALSDEQIYFSTLASFSERQQIYDGLTATIDCSATLLNSVVSKYQIDQMARISQWNQDQYNIEKAKVENNLSKQTEIFLSFYTADRKNDDLHKSKTKWRIFLDANGHRYDGKVEKMKMQYTDVLSLYPKHNRWSTAYRVAFAVPTSLIEGSPAKLTITGPVGVAEFQFPSIAMTQN